jgi:CHC2 zinc finger
MEPLSQTTSTSSYGITLVLDPDEAGQRAAVTNGQALQELFVLWGIPRYPGEPISQALAIAQRTCDDLAETIQIQEATGQDTDQTLEMRLLVWDYMMDLYNRDKETAYSRALTAKEFEVALTIEDNPILPQHGRIDYAVIKEKVDIVDYISRHTELRPMGNKFRGKCPLPDHEDDTPSLWVYPESRSWYCFGCNRGGDVIDYARLRGVNLAHHDG